MRVALVVYDGVLNAECEAFSSVLGLVRGAEVVRVGAHRGTYAGPGGRQTVDLRFEEADDVDIAVVPGGLGCERAADDLQLRTFLIRMEHSARFVAASSTGTVVLAAAGLLHGAPAATHWLAGDLLRQYGSEADERRLVTTGNVITCEGLVSAVDAAFALVDRLDGPDAVERIRDTLLERGQPLLRPDPRWWRLAEPVRNLLAARARDDEVPGRSDQPLVTPVSVMIELVDNEDLARQLKRSSRRRR